MSALSGCGVTVSCAVVHHADQYILSMQLGSPQLPKWWASLGMMHVAGSVAAKGMHLSAARST